MGLVMAANFATVIADHVLLPFLQCYVHDKLMHLSSIRAMIHMNSVMMAWMSVVVAATAAVAAAAVAVEMATVAAHFPAAHILIHLALT